MLKGLDRVVAAAEDASAGQQDCQPEWRSSLTASRRELQRASRGSQAVENFSSVFRLLCAFCPSAGSRKSSSAETYGNVARRSATAFFARRCLREDRAGTLGEGSGASVYSRSARVGAANRAGVQARRRTASASNRQLRARIIGRGQNGCLSSRLEICLLWA